MSDEKDWSEADKEMMDRAILAEEQEERPVPQEAVPLFHYLGGPAGTGKSTLVREQAERPNSGVALASTTGIAAINLGGQKSSATTINALLGYFDTEDLKHSYVKGWLQWKLRRLRDAGVKTIVLDEVSMLDKEQLTVIVRAIDEVNGLHEGGDWESHYRSMEEVEEGGESGLLGLHLVGDHCQLPPVKADFAFNSPAWDRFERGTTLLTQIHRQADPAFIEALRHCRVGNADAALEYFGPRMESVLDRQFDGLTIYAKNDEVDRANILRLDECRGREVAFTAKRWGKQRSEWTKQIPDVLALKVGARVMVLANKRKEDNGRPTAVFSYVNGDLGVLMEMERVEDQEGPEESTTERLPLIEGAYVKLDRTAQVVYIDTVLRQVLEPLKDGRLSQLLAEGKGNLVKYERDRFTGRLQAHWEVTGEITYMPLRLAYASTVHKCLVETTSVFSRRGLIGLDELGGSGERILGNAGQFNELRTTATSIYRDAWRVTTRLGFDLIGAPDHPVLVAGGEFVELGRLLRGDRLVLGAVVGNCGFSPELSAETAWLLGALTGDGAINDPVEGNIHFCSSDRGLQERFIKAVSGWGATPGTRRDGKGAYVTSKPLRQFLARLGLGYATACAKRVPSVLWTHRAEVAGAFLQGLFDTDGHVGRSGLVYATSSPYLAREVQLLLLALGIPARRRMYQGAERPYFQLRINAVGLPGFKEMVGFSRVSRKTKLDQLHPNRIIQQYDGTDEVVEVADLGVILPMIDIEVDGDNTFVAGGIVTHNCQGLSLDKIQVSISNQFFSNPGSVYVALSRARSMEGLRLVGNPDQFRVRCQADGRVRRFW